MHIQLDKFILHSWLKHFVYVDHLEQPHRIEFVKPDTKGLRLYLPDIGVENTFWSGEWNKNKNKKQKSEKTISLLNVIKDLIFPRVDSFPLSQGILVLYYSILNLDPLQVLIFMLPSLQVGSFT